MVSMRCTRHLRIWHTRERKLKKSVKMPIYRSKFIDGLTNVRYDLLCREHRRKDNEA